MESKPGMVKQGPRMPGSVQQLGHIVLFVADLNKSVEFYRDILGWPPTIDPDWMPAAAFRAGNTHHDLLPIEVGADAQPLPTGKHLGGFTTLA